MYGSLLASAGCTSTTPAHATADAAGATVDVAGHWLAACTPSPQADGSTQYFTLEFHDTAVQWQVAYSLFADATCATKLATIGIEGHYEIGAVSSVAGPSGSAAAVHEAVFHFDHKTITPFVQGVADALNGACGGGFVTGQAKDVYDAGCTAFGQYPRASCEADYDLVWRDGDKLRFGDRPADNNLCTAARRPTQLAQVVLDRAP